MIKPTVGRMVHFRSEGPSGPTEAAVIAGVNSDSNVNLTVFSMYGTPGPRVSVRLKQAEEEVPESPYCEFMAFQVGQSQAADTKGGLMDRVTTLEAQVADLVQAR